MLQSVTYFLIYIFAAWHEEQNSLSRTPRKIQDPLAEMESACFTNGFVLAIYFSLNTKKSKCVCLCKEINAYRAGNSLHLG